MIERRLSKHLSFLATKYPVVTVVGPRQSGKTTLVKHHFKDYAYCNLENPEIRSVAESDPKTLLTRYKPPVIFDEIQRVPELLSWIQVSVDESNEKGAYILTGSSQFLLHQTVSQSLAGRTPIIRLLPFSVRELAEAGIVQDKNTYMFRGFLPRIYDEDIPSDIAYRDYFQTYVERDIRQLVNVRNLIPFENFLRLLAGRVGQLVNLSSLSNDVGVSSTTLAEWISILEASFLIFRLPPYYNNFGKRITKSPKIYFTETGMAAWLLGIRNPDQIERDPLHGNLFENMVVMEFVKAAVNRGLEPNLYFFRDSKGNEVDLVIDRQRRLIPVEIKSARTFTDEFTKNLTWFQKNIPTAENGAVVYAGDMELEAEHYRSMNFMGVDRLYKEVMAG
jgi:uncharacterized protein